MVLDCVRLVSLMLRCHDGDGWDFLCRTLPLLRIRRQLVLDVATGHRLADRVRSRRIFAGVGCGAALTLDHEHLVALTRDLPPDIVPTRARLTTGRQVLSVTQLLVAVDRSWGSLALEQVAKCLRLITRCDLLAADDG